MNSKKPTIYLIDGLNYVRSHMDAMGENEDEAMRNFLDWLEETANCDGMSGSQMRVVLDGGYRNVGLTVRGGLKIDFSDGEHADDVLLEHALYLKQVGRRAVLVSSDGALLERAKSEGLRTMYCEKFQSLCRSVLPEKPSF